MRILIAEDDATSRTVLTAVLRKQGHEVVATVDGAQAWQAMQKADAPRLVVLDWMMPEMDGPDVCRSIRARETDQPPYVIMLTARGDKTDIIIGLDHGADDYLAKPFDPGELRARINVGLRVVEMQDRLAVKFAELRAAHDHIKTLQGILPICMYCHKIHTDTENWDRLEKYITEHSEAKLTHGICPECMKIQMSELATMKKKDPV